MKAGLIFLKIIKFGYLSVSEYLNKVIRETAKEILKEAKQFFYLYFC
ncbi:hypothetical protein LCGC14_1175050 [marine sediment metagenome]|uniref:Uncharacterized protein n=1 Tax=marine sediment metagenome TaxID=412755 RepID=A0A0F9P6T3_9ZZZZ